MTDTDLGFSNFFTCSMSKCKNNNVAQTKEIALKNKNNSNLGDFGFCGILNLSFSTDKLKQNFD